LKRVQHIAESIPGLCQSKRGFIIGYWHDSDLLQVLRH